MIVGIHCFLYSMIDRLQEEMYFSNKRQSEVVQRKDTKK